MGRLPLQCDPERARRPHLTRGLRAPQRAPSSTLPPHRPALPPLPSHPPPAAAASPGRPGHVALLSVWIPHTLPAVTLRIRSSGRAGPRASRAPSASALPIDQALLTPVPSAPAAPSGLARCRLRHDTPSLLLWVRSRPSLSLSATARRL